MFDNPDPRLWYFEVGYSRCLITLLSSLIAVLFHQRYGRSVLEIPMAGPLHLLAPLFLFVLIYIYVSSFYCVLIRPFQSPYIEEKRIVVASLEGDDTSWIQRRLPDWPVSRYIVDDDDANHTVAINKGREAMVYLT